MKKEDVAQNIRHLLFIIIRLCLEVNDATLCVLIEDMNSGCIECELDRLSCCGLRARRNSGNELSLADHEVEINLCTHKLGNVNVCVESTVRKSFKSKLIL